MGPHVNLSSFLQESVGHFYDPQHGHSFHRVALSGLPAVQHSRLFFRDCLVCQQRILTLGKSSSSSARIRRIPESKLSKSQTQVPCLFPPAATSVAKPFQVIRRSPGGSISSTTTPSTPNGESDAICQCLDCGNFVHRECLSQCHAHRKCRGHDDLLLRCPQTRMNGKATLPLPPVPALFPTSQPVIKRVISVKRKYSSDTVTISALIDELSEDRRHGGRADDGLASTSSKSTKTTATTVMKRIAPFLAAGGVIGAIALGPAAGVIAGLNMLVASVSVEGMVAGLGFTAATAAATASHQIKKKHEKKRLQEEMKSGAWAMQICWKVKQDFRDMPVSDDTYRKDVELLRRFQLPRRTDTSQPADQHAPTKDEVYALLFGIFSASTEFLTHVNVELYKAFTERFTSRSKRSSSVKPEAVSKETLQDARMYIAHVVGATMQTFPSLSSTDFAIVACSQGVERVIFDDIYKPVMGVLDDLFADENTLFYNSLADIRRQQNGQDQLTMMLQQLSPTWSGATESPEFDTHLKDAERMLVEMLEVAKSPMHKLELLCDAFRSICCFADKLHKTASNADILIPIVCALLVASPRLAGSDGAAPTTGTTRMNFVSQIAFTSYFTDGGGKGVEGYVLTTFQAALQVIAAVDLSHGRAKELEFYMHHHSTESSEDEGGGDSARTSSTSTEERDQDEFFDARGAEEEERTVGHGGGVMASVL